MIRPSTRADVERRLQCKITSDPSLKGGHGKIEDGFSQLRGYFLGNKIDVYLRKEGIKLNVAKTGSVSADGLAHR